MSVRQEFPGFTAATLEIARDNGAINRFQTESAVLKRLAKFLKEQEAGQVHDAEKWLVSLSQDDLETVCSGEHGEAQAIVQNAPPFTDTLLNQIFDEVI